MKFILDYRQNTTARGRLKHTTAEEEGRTRNRLLFRCSVLELDHTIRQIWQSIYLRKQQNLRKGDPDEIERETLKNNRIESCVNITERAQRNKKTQQKNDIL